ncbi:MAG: MoaD/ThiS family protein [Candidatus Bathyarchaeota archaeon]|nr:MoaD/ThiS family protein [Candidatus Bathyarchaeota archaeon]
MKVTVKFVGSLRTLTDKSKVTIDFAKAVPLKEIFKMLCDNFPKLEQILGEQKLSEAKSSMLILVNEKEISVLNGLETAIKDGDAITLVPVLHGG